MTEGLSFHSRAEIGSAALGSADEGQRTVYVLAGGVGNVGGAARAALLLCEGLAAIGLTVRVYVSESPDAAARERLLLAGVRVVVPFVRHGWRWDMPRRALLVRLVLDAWRSRPAFIQCVGIQREAAFLLRVPMMPKLLLWETTEALPGIKFVNMGMQKVINRAAALLVPSRTVAVNVRRTYGYRGPLVRLPFWVEPCRVTTMSPRPRGANILYVGRLDEDKGLDVLVPAFLELRKRYPRARLVIRGGGGNEAYVRRLVGESEGIDVGGRVEDDHYEQLMQEADIFVLPSRHEGYPLSLLEACARSIPVVATTVGSIPEMFQDSDAAVLVPPGDQTALVDAFRQLFREPDAIHARRRAAALQLYERMSSPSVIRSLLRDTYLGSPARNPSAICSVHLAPK